MASPSDEDAPDPEPDDAPPEAPTPEAPRKRKKKRAPKAEPFAAYLARLHVVEKGFRPGTVPDARALAEASSIILTYSDGMSFVIVAILDAEDDPARGFDLALADVVQIGVSCGAYTGSVNGAKLAVGIRFIEIRDGVREQDKRRLDALRRSLPGFDKVVVTGFILSPRTGEVWSTLTFGWLQERWFRAALTGPRKTAAELAAAAAPLAAGDAGPPYLTGAILALTAALFLVENSFAVRPETSALTPSIDTLVAMGGVSSALVHEGQWWRLFTATLLHADPMHLILNGVGLFLGGVVLESLLGRAWLGALFVLGAVGGSLASITLNEPGLVSVGASGAIMGLLAAAMVASYRLPPAQRWHVQMPLLRMLVPSLIPIAMTRTGGHVDFAAHLGGALTGAAAGLALLSTWPAAEPHPRFRRGAAAVAMAGAALYAFGFAQVQGAYAGARDAASVALIPNDRIGSVSAKDADDLLVRFPRDPRSRWLAAQKAAEQNDLPAAEKHLRAALAEEGVLRRSFPDRKLEAALRGMLARVLDAQGRSAEAREAAKPACDTGSNDLRGFCP
jgi:rhomboid protease GluP